MAENLVEALGAEIERVGRKHERWLGMMREFPEMSRGMTLGARLMQVQIDAAKKALGSGDILEMIPALESLREYDDND